MTDRRSFLRAGLGLAAAYPLVRLASPTTPAAAAASFEYVLTDAQWRAKLPAASYEVLRHEATERAFTSPLNDEHRAGTFACKGCALPLFSSSTKFDSGTGWPSFYRTLPRAVGMTPVGAFGYNYFEVHCRRCGGHLGHVFDDGPPPTGKRYCINGVAITFNPTKA